MKRIPTPDWLKLDEESRKIIGLVAGQADALEDHVVELHEHGVIALAKNAPGFRFEALCKPGRAFEVGARHTHFCATLKEARDVLATAEVCDVAGCDWCDEEVAP